MTFQSESLMHEFSERLVHMTEDDIDFLPVVEDYRKSVMAEIVGEVSKTTGVSIIDIIGNRRIRHMVRARQMVMFIARREGMTLTEIGSYLRRDHTTVIHGIKAEYDRREYLKRLRSNQ